VAYQVPEQGTQPQLLAVALSGPFKSYFADKPVPASGSEAGEAGEGAAAAGAARAVPLKESPPTRLVLIANAAFLSDFVARMIGQVDGSFFVENLRFLENAIDWITLDNDMLEIRSRGLVSRRLERTGKGTEIAVESLSYAVPALLLAGLGLQVRWRRRHTAPLVGRAGGQAPSAAEPREEAGS
jgi:ABC-type uncharacterized transport system involved in gliding motility auxiliary subunit